VTPFAFVFGELDRVVDHDPVEPRGKGTLIVELVDAFRCLEEGTLGNILCQHPVTDDQVGGLHSLVAVYQRLQGLKVSLLQTGNSNTIIHAWIRSREFSTYIIFQDRKR
jgi:hypothetical protein